MSRQESLYCEIDERGQVVLLNVSQGIKQSDDLEENHTIRHVWDTIDRKQTDVPPENELLFSTK